MNDKEIHTCVYCGQEAHYQFKNGKWCCTPKMSQCPANRKRFSDKTKNAHEKRKEITGKAGFKKGQSFIEIHKEYPFSGEHVCVHCGQYAEYKLKNGHWCCQPTVNKCPEVRKRLANKRKPDGSPLRDYKTWRNNLPEETKKQMLTGISSKESHLKSGQTFSKRVKEGKIIPSWKGRKHTEEEKDQIRISTVKYFEEVKCTGGAKFSKRGCEFMDKLNESKGWHLQHGMNGGEVVVGGYYLDGYDKDLNIAFEYDEPAHYVDVQNNVLKERDIRRMNYIHSKLNCRFFRYNERMDSLYEVDFSV